MVDTRGNKINVVDDVEDFEELEEDPLGSAIQTKYGAKYMESRND